MCHDGGGDNRTKGTTVVCVQPQEPLTGAPPPPPVVPPPSGRLADRRLRLWLAMGLGVLLLLCLGGAGVFFSLYDNATKIQRAEPDAVVDNFLRAYLVNRDDKEASLYQCKSGGDFAQIAAFRSQIQTTERKFSVGVRVDWTSLVVSKQGAQGTVSTDVKRALSDGSEKTSDHWQFRVVDQSGWRVCGATEQP